MQRYLDKLRELAKEEKEQAKRAFEEVYYAMLPTIGSIDQVYYIHKWLLNLGGNQEFSLLIRKFTETGIQVENTQRSLGK